MRPVGKTPASVNGFFRRPIGLRFGTVKGRSRLFPVPSGFSVPFPFALTGYSFTALVPVPSHSPLRPGTSRRVRRPPSEQQCLPGCHPPQTEAQLGRWCVTPAPPRSRRRSGSPALSASPRGRNSRPNSPVAEVLHPVRTAPAVVIHVARSLAVGVQRVQEVPCPPATSFRAGSGGTHPARYWFFRQYLFPFYHSCRFSVMQGMFRYHPVDLGGGCLHHPPLSRRSRPPAGDSVSAA